MDAGNTGEGSSKKQTCCWMSSPGLELGQHKHREHPRPPGNSSTTRLHFPKTETTERFWGTSVNSVIILDVAEPNQSQLQPLRPAPEPLLSVSDSRIFCVCSSPTLYLIRSNMGSDSEHGTLLGGTLLCSDCSAENVRNQSGLRSHGAP